MGVIDRNGERVGVDQRILVAIGHLQAVGDRPRQIREQIPRADRQSDEPDAQHVPAVSGWRRTTAPRQGDQRHDAKRSEHQVPLIEHDLKPANDPRRQPAEPTSRGVGGERRQRPRDEHLERHPLIWLRWCQEPR